VPYFADKGSAVATERKLVKNGNCQQFEQDEDGRLESGNLATKVGGYKPFEGRLSYQLRDHNRRVLGLEINYTKVNPHSPFGQIRSR